MGKLSFGAGVLQALLALKKKPSPLFDHLKKVKQAGGLTITENRSVAPGTWRAGINLEVHQRVAGEEEKLGKKEEKLPPMWKDRVATGMSGWFLIEAIGAAVGAADGGIEGAWKKYNGEQELALAAEDKDLANSVSDLEANVARLAAVVNSKVATGKNEEEEDDGDE